MSKRPVEFLLDTAEEYITSSHATAREQEKGYKMSLIAIARILDEMAGPYCGHGHRKKSCPYYHQEPYVE